MSLQISAAQLSDRQVLNALTTPLAGSSRSDSSRFRRNTVLGPPGSPTPSNACSDADINVAGLTTTNVSTVTQVDDTIHYLSPASMSPLSARTVNEGDLYGVSYKSPSFMQFLHAYGKVTEGSFVSSSISCIEPELQRTLAIVKPEAMEYEDVIVRAIVEVGFLIIRKRYIHLTPEQVSEIYSQYYGSPAFPHMVVSMSIGPILSLCLAGINAVAKWRDIVGPDRVLRAEWFFPMSMRVRFGLHDDIPGAVHASETVPEASKENRYVNPESILEPIISEENRVWDYCNLYINPTLLNGLTEVLRIKPVDPILHLAEWLLKNNPFQPRFTDDIAVLPT